MMDEGARLINNMFQVISMSLQFRRGYYYGNRKIDWASILCVKVFFFFLFFFFEIRIQIMGISVISWSVLYAMEWLWCLTTALLQVSDKLDHIKLYRVHIAMCGIQTHNFSPKLCQHFFLFFHTYFKKCWYRFNEPVMDTTIAHVIVNLFYWWKLKYPGTPTDLYQLTPQELESNSYKPVAIGTYRYM